MNLDPITPRLKYRFLTGCRTRLPRFVVSMAIFWGAVQFINPMLRPDMATWEMAWRWAGFLVLNHISDVVLDKGRT